MSFGGLLLYQSISSKSIVAQHPKRCWETKHIPQMNFWKVQHLVHNIQTNSRKTQQIDRTNPPTSWNIRWEWMFVCCDLRFGIRKTSYFLVIWGAQMASSIFGRILASRQLTMLDLGGSVRTKWIRSACLGSLYGFESRLSTLPADNNKLRFFLLPGVDSTS